MKARQPKYNVKPVPFDQLRPGDKIMTGYGVCEVASVETVGDLRVRVNFTAHPAIVWYRANWPMLVSANPKFGG